MSPGRADSHDPDEVNRRQRKREILHAIREAKADGETAMGKDDPVTVSVIADRIDASASTVHYHCNWLSDDGIIESRISLVNGRGPTQKGFVITEDLDAEEPQFGHIPAAASAD